MPELATRKLVSRYAFYGGLVSLLTFMLFGRSPQVRWQEIALFSLLTLAAESLSIHFPQTYSTMSVGFVLVHSAILLFPPPAAAWIATCGTVRRVDVLGRVPFRQVVYNRMQLGVAAFSASYVFRLLGGDLASYTSAHSLVAGVASGLTYFLFNSAGVLIGFVVERVPRWWHTFFTGLKWVAAGWITVLPISYLLAVTYRNLTPLTLLLYVFPLFVAQQSFRMYVEARKQYVDTIRSLAAALEAKDPYTFGHAERVACLAVEVGRRLRLSQDELEDLQVAGILHDIGKIGISDAILRKTDRFTSEDFREMMKHPIIGARIVGSVQALDRVAAWVRHHHERVDGQGYPAGLRGEEIPIGARILAVVDAFDAMTSARPYKPALTTEEALFELERCAGTQFDPDVVRAFRTVVEDKAYLRQILAGAGELTEVLLQGIDAEIPPGERVRQVERAAPTAYGSVMYHPQQTVERRH